MAVIWKYIRTHRDQAGFELFLKDSGSLSLNKILQMNKRDKNYTWSGFKSGKTGVFPHSSPSPHFSSCYFQEYIDFSLSSSGNKF